VAGLGLAACGSGEDGAEVNTTVRPPTTAPAPATTAESPRTAPIETTTSPRPETVSDGESGREGEGGGDIPTTTSSEPGGSRGPYDAGGLPSIANQLTRQLGYRPAVLEVVLSEDVARFQVQDPAKPRNVDEYTWRGGVIEGPEPVRLSPRAELRSNLFPLYSINLRAAAALARRADRLPIEGSEAGTMVIRRNLPFMSEVVWFVNVGGTRESKQIRADARGRVYEII
jgi:hypothetical protein